MQRTQVTENVKDLVSKAILKGNIDMFGEFLCTNINSAITVSLQVFLAEKGEKCQK